MIKKSQSAIEFLISYGWIVLSLIIILAAFSLFGVFKPGKTIAQSCILNPPFLCQEYSASLEGVDLVIYNGYSDDVYIKEINISKCGILDLSSELRLHSKETEEFYHIDCKKPISGELNGDIFIRYQQVNGIDLFSNGRISVSVISSINFNNLSVEAY